MAANPGVRRAAEPSDAGAVSPRWQDPGMRHIPTGPSEASSAKTA
jgi:hypothetical protein